MVAFPEYVIIITALTFAGLFSIRCRNCLYAEKIVEYKANITYMLE